jgi:hypothetical protein
MNITNGVNRLWPFGLMETGSACRRRQSSGPSQEAVEKHADLFHHNLEDWDRLSQTVSQVINLYHH